jgi:hypothetical protein
MFEITEVKIFQGTPKIAKKIVGNRKTEMAEIFYRRYNAVFPRGQEPENIEPIRTEIEHEDPLPNNPFLEGEEEF